MADVAVILRRESGIGVPAKSLIQRGKSEVLFRIQDDVAMAVPVEPGMESDGWVQLRSSPVAEGTPVVTMGQFLLRNGVPVELHAEQPDRRL
jgi:multidrug efflux pump subunit AcrA (membrane-fusion protein)